MANTGLFPASSTGAETFAQVTTALAAIEAHLKDRVLARAESRRVKATTRAVVFDYMKTLAMAARRVTRREPSTNPFRLPKRRSLKVELATARAFMDEAENRQDQFVRLGLAPTFVSDFRALVDVLQQATDVRLSSKTVRGKAQAGMDSDFLEEE